MVNIDIQDGTFSIGVPSSLYVVPSTKWLVITNIRWETDFAAELTELVSGTPFKKFNGNMGGVWPEAIPHGVAFQDGLGIPFRPNSELAIENTSGPGTSGNLHLLGYLVDA